MVVVFYYFFEKANIRFDLITKKYTQKKNNWLPSNTG